MNASVMVLPCTDRWVMATIAPGVRSPDLVGVIAPSAGPVMAELCEPNDPGPLVEPHAADLADVDNLQPIAADRGVK